MEILSPKREPAGRNIERGWYDYYAGYSAAFTESILNNFELQSDSVVLDPWNGAGTTTTAAAIRQLPFYGFDLNPVMALVAKASGVGRTNISSLKPLSHEILAEAKRCLKDVDANAEQLNLWFSESAASAFRSIEFSIQKILVEGPYCSISERKSLEDISPITAFFYVSLFKSVKKFLAKFKTSNPTWIKGPANVEDRLSPSEEEVYYAFSNEVSSLLEGLRSNSFVPDVTPDTSTIDVASSTNLPLNDESVDFGVTSPPYCTRIDYAVKTKPELLVLGYEPKTTFDKLRRSLIGTSTVNKTDLVPSESWGETCLGFLNHVYAHPSNASKTYYYKNHLQYFYGLKRSIDELSRVLKKDGRLVMVLQSSYYKEVFNDLPAIATEMASFSGLERVYKKSFDVRKDMSRVNKGTKKYRNFHLNYEAVLVLEK